MSVYCLGYGLYDWGSVLGSSKDSDIVHRCVLTGRGAH